MTDSISSIIVKTDVTCVKFYENYILAGIGGNINVFSQNGKFLSVCNIFEGQKIHGIVPNSTNKLAVFGANLLKIVEFDFINGKVVRCAYNKYCEDWIFAVQWLDSDSQIATVFAKNYVTLWSTTPHFSKIQNVGCEERSTLYCATVVNTSWENLFVLAGTVYGQILIWKPANSPYIAPVLWRLDGHDGAIFSIAYSKPQNIIASTSDDRTVRLWSITQGQDIFSQNFHKNSATITLKHTMYGHIARVFRCTIINDLIITAGEDSFVHIWTSTGNLLRKFETHQGGCIWALDYSPESDLIMTGGGDFGISLYPLHLQREITSLDFGAPETPRSLKFTGGGNAVVVTESGMVKYYNFEGGKWVDVQLHSDLKSYAILEVSESKNLIAFAGFRGSVHIYREQKGGLKNICSVENPDEKRIFSLQWLSEEQFLISSTDGVMSLWRLSESEEIQGCFLKKVREIVLPPSKERWATCATICFGENLAVGDRKGNVHIYGAEGIDPVQTFKKAHCHLGVTSLHFWDKQLVSLGRNGTLKKFNQTSSGQLTQIKSDKLPFSWLASLISHDILAGFSGSNFVIFNLKTRRTLLDLNCGGGNRSWDVFITPSGIFQFVFIKDKTVNLYSEIWSKISICDLVPGHHTKEINCGAVIGPQCSGNKLVFISGGEDTTVRLSSIKLGQNQSEFGTFYTCKSHLSSVRCLTTIAAEKGSYYLFSGGGRAQIIFQKVDVNTAETRIKCHQLDFYYKQLDDDESETRIMDLAAVNLGENILLAAACSDGNIKLFSVPLNAPKLKFLCNIFYQPKCILKLAYFYIFDRHIMVSMATDGKSTFWDMSNVCQEVTPEVNLTPFYSVKIHQSGINSCCVQKLDEETYLLATGGDDNLVALTVFSFTNCSDGIKVSEVAKWKTDQAHGAQVTGIFIQNNYVITTSVDQYVSLFKYNLSHKNIGCRLVKQYCSSVADIQGMQCVCCNGDLYVFLYGKGIEICKIPNVCTNFTKSAIKS